jgi:hypothetical protein
MANIETAKYAKEAHPLTLRVVPLKGDIFGLINEFIKIQRINPPLGGKGGA